MGLELGVVGARRGVAGLDALALGERAVDPVREVQCGLAVDQAADEHASVAQDGRPQHAGRDVGAGELRQPFSGRQPAVVGGGEVGRTRLLECMHPGQVPEPQQLPLVVEVTLVAVGCGQSLDLVL